MEYISKTYRQACREIPLLPEQKILFMRLLREMSVNAVKCKKAWAIKEDFIALWWISIGRFPSLAEPVTCGIIMDWVRKHLPFELTDTDYRFLID